MPRESLFEYLDLFRNYGGQVAYLERRGYRTITWTYAEVAEFALRFAAALRSRDLALGDRILLWAPNSAEWVAAFLGCALQGIVVVPIDDIATADFALRVYGQVSAKLLVCSRQHSQASLPLFILDDIRQSLELPAPPPPAAVVHRGDTLEIIFTSGTTADPKGVVISHGNVLGNLEPLEAEIQKYLKYERFVHPVRFLNLLPLSHVFGQFLGIFLPPLLGGVVVFQDAMGPSEVINTIRRERISVLVAVPRILQSLKNKLERDLEQQHRAESFRKRFQASVGKHFLRRWWIFRRERRLFGWKFWAFICGGATLDRVTEEFWGRLGYAVVQGYGLTETTSIISVNHPFHLGKGSVGKILAGREVKLAPDGEILVRGSGVASGYWSPDHLRPAAGQEGWYHTGDIGELDPQGNLYFKGRKKDVIVTPSGMNVYPEDLENALRHQPEVKDCVVIALPQDGNAEPCAVMILSEDASPEVVVARANQSLAAYQRIRQWFVWPGEDFPRTATQKPRTNMIQAAVLEKTARAASPATADPTPLSQLIAQITGRSPAELSPRTNLDADLNLSSLDRVELLSALEDRYQVDLSETGFSAASTVADLEKMLRRGTAARVQYHYPAWGQRCPVTWIRFLTNYLLLLPSVFLLGWPRILGREHLHDTRPPVLIVCNHISDVDLGFVWTALPARFRRKLATATAGEALELYRKPPTGKNFFERLYYRATWILGVSLLNLFPLPRQAGFRQSFDYAGQSVDRGYSVLVFPEGRHTKDGKLLPFQAGVGLLAKNLGIPVVPMRIHGLFELAQAGRKIAPPHTITVRIGKPTQFDPGADPRSIARELQKRVEEL
jgi:long-chain acyl-CoA synthetase